MTQLTLKQWMAVRDMTVLQFADAIGVNYMSVFEKTLGIDYKVFIWT